MNKPSTDKSIEEIQKAIGNDLSISTELPGGGFLHIERQLPFICLYRGDAQYTENALASLLRGTPAYLLLNSGAGQRQQHEKVLLAVLEKLSEYFDQICLLELWGSQPPDTDSEAPVFAIRAPLVSTPAKFLEEFENALLHISVEGFKAGIEISYERAIAPPGLDPVLSSSRLEALNCVLVGLAIAPIYLDKESGAPLPFHLQDLRQGLTRALKRGFYAFAHYHTHIRPRHFHELGSRFIPSAAWQTDRELANISASFDLLLYVSPVNVSAAWQEFEAAHYEREVEFLYRARNVNPSLLKRQLFQIPIEEIADPTLAYIFAEKRNEMDRQISLVADRNSPRFLLGSRQIYGDVDSDLLEQADLLLKMIGPADTGDYGDLLTPYQIADCAQSEMAKYRAQDPALKAAVIVREDVPGILVSQGNLLIGQDAGVTSSRLKALLNHEIGTHIVTHHNGSLQPFRELSVGMAGYEELQEGLAVLAEYLVGGLSPGRLRILAARVLAVHCITSGADFIDCFRMLYKEHGFHPHAAFNITMRVYRGGGYTKDIVYLRGLNQVLKAVAQGHSLESLYLGKVSHQHLDFVEELQWRRILKPPAIKPLFLDEKEAKLRLEALARGISLTDLVNE